MLNRRLIAPGSSGGLSALKFEASSHGVPFCRFATLQWRTVEGPPSVRPNRGAWQLPSLRWVYVASHTSGGLCVARLTHLRVLVLTMDAADGHVPPSTMALEQGKPCPAVAAKRMYLSLSELANIQMPDWGVASPVYEARCL